MAARSVANVIAKTHHGFAAGLERSPQSKATVRLACAAIGETADLLFLPLD
jgi:hypothetical protein